MEIHLQVGRRHLVVLAAVAAAVVGGVAYAAIPGAGGVYTACSLNSNGSLRLIDPSLSSGPLSRCTPNETQVQWNEQGQPGAPGQPGANGKDGKDGVSPRVEQLAAGDTHCQGGGASITDAAGSVAYDCNGAAGQPGRDGAPFNGTFTSPNGQFRLTVADGGVTIIGPDSSITLPASGGIAIRGGDLSVRVDNSDTIVLNDASTYAGRDRRDEAGRDWLVQTGRDRTNAIGNNESTTVGRDQSLTITGHRTASVGKDESIDVAGNRTDNVAKDVVSTVGRSRTTQVGVGDSLSVGSSLQVQSAGAMSFLGSLLSLNGGSACKAAARLGDPVSSTAITGGSASVCIGG